MDLKSTNMNFNNSNLLKNGVMEMKKKRINFIELVKKNKEELLKDPQQLAKIEERLDARHSK
jgi:hypothetical protein